MGDFEEFYLKTLIEAIKKQFPFLEDQLKILFKTFTGRNYETSND